MSTSLLAALAACALVACVFVVRRVMGIAPSALLIMAALAAFGAVILALL